MNTEQKAKAYDKAIEQLRTMMPNWENLSYNGKTFLQDLVYVFPELRESEDEKMMHQLHSWMKEFGGAEEYTEKVYTWLKSLLEKQAQTFTKRDVDEAFVEGMACAKNELEKQGKQEEPQVYETEDGGSDVAERGDILRLYDGKYKKLL